MIEYNLPQASIIFITIIIVMVPLYSMNETNAMPLLLCETTANVTTPFSTTNTGSTTCLPTFRTYGELVNNETVSKIVNWCDAGHWFMNINESVSSMEIILERVYSTGTDEAIVYVGGPDSESIKVSTMNKTVRTIDNPAAGQWSFEIWGTQSKDVWINLTVILRYESPTPTEIADTTPNTSPTSTLGNQMIILMAIGGGFAGIIIVIIVVLRMKKL